MTEQPDRLPEAGQGPDMRANAWLGAWERIEAAQKLKVGPKNRVVDPLPEIYWATLAEADVLARLATADEDPGCDVGRHLVQRAERIAEAKARGRNLVEQVRARAEANGAE